ncbi:FkbM family methyltransferase [Natronorubrum texcoconense]|uniref:Methyltransferase, FkbM family n=1 Tax=Natronorubrum texcoconense TaxID=1095776 RepID=A0A1G9B620_9EURY|nr:FkbM family methyltransferase [Natronorubrum texcoconense]SDK34938.1 methyltransferase, FkbM family [Natronorubrum texcoconense]
METSELVSLANRTLQAARSVGYRGYYRLAAANYDRELLARRNRTSAGTVRCYEPLNRHGSDAMLAKLAACCGPSDVVYDIGANVGIYALALASGAPGRRVVAFEPSSTTVERLRRNVRANDLERRIDVLACGVGDESGEHPFYVSTYPELSAFDRASATRWGAAVADVPSVPIRRLDDIVLEDDLWPPDHLKIDVEGAAPAVLRGARTTLERHRPTVFVELHDEGLAGDVPGETRAILEALDYEVYERKRYWRCEPR